MLILIPARPSPPDNMKAIDRGAPRALRMRITANPSNLIRVIPAKGVEEPLSWHATRMAEPSALDLRSFSYDAQFVKAAVC